MFVFVCIVRYDDGTCTRIILVHYTLVAITGKHLQYEGKKYMLLVLYHLMFIQVNFLLMKFQLICTVLSFSSWRTVCKLQRNPGEKKRSLLKVHLLVSHDNRWLYMAVTAIQLHS